MRARVGAAAGEPGRPLDIRQTLTVGGDRFRVGPWHADSRVASIAPSPEQPRPTVSGVLRCVEHLAEAGYSTAITSALHPQEARAFLEAGFSEYDRLLVLDHDLVDLDPPRPRPDSVVLRRARRSDREVALEVDARAFPPFWRLDAAMLREAEAATPITRFRVAQSDGQIVAYAITGRGGRQAFLQRLATDPDSAGRGVGSALVVDSLRWARRHRCRRLLVNTQLGNLRALELYQRLGFSPTSTDLVVLTRSVP